MKVAIGTDDKRTIRKSHFYGSRYFLVIEILNAQVVAKELRNNTYVEAEKAKEDQGQTERIINLLKDCSLFMARSFGRRSVLEISSCGIDCITTDIENINQAISSYLDGQVKGFEYFDRDAKAFMPCTQRAFK